MERKYLKINGDTFSLGENDNVSSIIESMDRELGYEIDMTDSAKVFKRIKLSSHDESFELGLIDGYDFKIKGLTGSEPKVEDGTLIVDGLEGKLWLPKRIPELVLALETRDGSINGEVFHPGYIRTRDGSLNLILKSPLKFNIETMISIPNGIDSPLEVKNIDTLEVSTRYGKVNVINYSI